MNKNNDLNALFNQLKIQTPQKCSLLSSPPLDDKNLFLNNHLNFSNASTPTSSAHTSTATSPGTPEAVRHHGGTSPVPFELYDKLLSIIKNKPHYDREQRNQKEIQHKTRRFTQIMKQKSRTIKNPIIKKFLQKKQE